MKRGMVRALVYVPLAAAVVGTWALHQSLVDRPATPSLPGMQSVIYDQSLPRASAPAGHKDWQPFQFNGETYYYVPLARR